MISPVERVGKAVTNGSGYRATCIAYRTCKDVDVQFDDGTVVNCKWGNFVRGSVRNPNQIKSSYKRKESIQQGMNRVGEKVTCKNGLVAEIIKYCSERDITVQFDDGTVVEKVRYSNFKSGNIKNPNVSKNPSVPPMTERLGQTFSKKGYTCTIIEYKSTRDVTVQFDSGEVVKTTYRRFKDRSVSPFTGVPIADRYIGRQGVVKCNGEQMTIVGYRNSNDIDVKFDDGTIIQTRLNVFNSGGCVNPNNLEGHKGGNIARLDHIGLEGKSNGGQSMKIVGYRKASDIDVEFENGVIYEHCRLSSFYKGEIRNPKYGLNYSDYMNCGVRATVTEWRSYRDIDVTFEDGSVVKSYWRGFQNGYTKHPTLKTRENNGSYLNFNVDKLVWRGETRDKTYYSCTCKTCNLNSILTPTEMNQHSLLCMG